MRRILAPAALAALALGAGFLGITWGLPSEERLAFLLAPGRRQDAALHRRMAEGRAELYRRMEERGRMPVDYIDKAETIEPGFREPPFRLLNSYRSFFLRSANPDEQKNLTYLAHMDPRRLRFEPYGVGYGGAYLYPLGAYYAALSAAGLIKLTGDLEVYFRDVRRMADVFLAGRIFNVLCFAACALLLYRLGLKSGQGRAGFWAALFFLASPVATLVMHTLNPYGWATAWFLLACLCLQDYLARASVGRLRLGAAALGVCVGSSLAFWPVLAALAAPVFLPRGLRGPRGGREAAFHVLEGAAIAGAVFAATNPYFFLRFDKYVDELVYLLHNNPQRASWGKLREFVGGFLAPNLGGGLTAAALAASLLLPFLAGPAQRLWSLVLWAGLLQLAGRVGSDFAHGRHFLPFFALAGLLAAQGLWGPLAARARRSAWALGLLLLCGSGAASASYLWNFRLEASGRGSRQQAARWIAANLPPGASVGFLTPPQPSDTPPMRLDLYRSVLFSDPVQLQGRLPEYMVACEIQAQGRLEEFLQRHYTVLASFGPRRPFPWIPVRGVYTLSNIGLSVHRRL